MYPLWAHPIYKLDHSIISPLYELWGHGKLSISLDQGSYVYFHSEKTRTKIVTQLFIGFGLPGVNKKCQPGQLGLISPQAQIELVFMTQSSDMIVPS